MSSPDTVVVELSDTLDLHAFSPRDLRPLLDDWLAHCVEAGYPTARLIHGKGTGQLRERAHSLLRHDPRVASFALAVDRSGWGATIVTIKR